MPGFACRHMPPVKGSSVCDLPMYCITSAFYFAKSSFLMAFCFLFQMKMRRRRVLQGTPGTAPRTEMLAHTAMQRAVLGLWAGIAGSPRGCATWSADTRPRRTGQLSQTGTHGGATETPTILRHPRARLHRAGGAPRSILLPGLAAAASRHLRAQLPADSLRRWCACV